MEDVAFIAPHDFSTFTFKAEGDEFVPDIDLAVPPVTKWIKHERSIIFVSRAAPFVYFVDIDSAVHWSLTLPSGSQPFDLAIWQNWLFVAAGDKVLLAAQNWQAEVEWITLPTDKEIDGIAVHEGRLLAVDNIATPKFVLIYELMPSGPMVPSRVELRIHGSYEEIEGVAYWDDKFVILSRTVGWGIGGKHIWLLDCASFEELDHIYCSEGMHPADDLGFWPLIDAKGIAAYRDVLVIAGGRYGLIATSLSVEPRSLSNDWYKDFGGRLYDDFRQLWPEASGKLPIVHVHFCDELAGFILTSIEKPLDEYDNPWEIFATERKLRTFSYFLSHEEVKRLLGSKLPGTMKGTPWKDNSPQAQSRRKAAGTSWKGRRI